MPDAIVIPGLAVTDYPGDTLTNSRRLYDALGGFWTRLFRERWTIRGLSIGQSEELIQRYYDLVDSVAALAVREVPELQRQRWLPVDLRRSEMQVFPFLFLPPEDPESAVFGTQPRVDWPATRPWHDGEIFQFGRSRWPSAGLYVFPLDPSIRKLPMLVDRLVEPSRVFIHNIDYRLEPGRIVFLFDPFAQPDLAFTPAIGPDGVPVVFVPPQTMPDRVDAYGQPDPAPPPAPVVDGALRLWGGHAGVDMDVLYDAFGRIFELRYPDPEVYKLVLEKVVNLFASGPTVHAVTALCNAFLGLRQVEQDGEVLEQAYTVDGTSFVVTSARVYTAPDYYVFSDLVWANGAVRAGAVLHVGDQLFTGVEYHDRVTSPDWWLGEFVAMEGRTIQPGSARVIVPGFMFLGDYRGPLIFVNDSAPPEHAIGVVAPVVGDIVFPFPAEVDPADAATFNGYLNAEAGRRETAKSLLRAHALENGGRVNPLDFLFRYFFQINTALVRIRFASAEQAARFTSFFRIITGCLPQHVLLVFSFEFSFPEDQFRMFLGPDQATGRLDADTSDAAGKIEGPAPERKPPSQLTFGPATLATDPDRLFTLGRFKLDAGGDPVVPEAEQLDLAAALETWNGVFGLQPPPGPNPQSLLFWPIFN
jgi:hypothetical protein